MDQPNTDVGVEECGTCKTLKDQQHTDNHRRRLEELTRELTVKETQIQHYIRKELKNRSRLESLQTKNVKLATSYEQLSKEYESLLDVLRNVETENTSLKEQLLEMQKREVRGKSNHKEEGHKTKTIVKQAPDEQHFQLLQATLKELTLRNRQLMGQLEESENKIQVLRSDLKDLLIRKAEGDRANERAVKFTCAVQKALQNLNMLEPEQPMDVKRNWRMLKDILKKVNIGQLASAFNHSLDCSKESPYASRSVGRLTGYRSR